MKERPRRERKREGEGKIYLTCESPDEVGLWKKCQKKMQRGEKNRRREKSVSSER